MATNTQEFVNPKSMITPGFAAASVATIAGALFSMLGIAMAASLVALSFFFGGVVFHSKEFAEMKRWGKGFFYILNSLIIFGMATGTHSLLDRGTRAPARGVGLSIVTTAFAQAEQSIPVFKQERPFFYDWTKPADLLRTSPNDKNIIKFQADKDFGPWRGFFINAGLATPNYKVRIAVDPSKLPAGAKSVTWYLPSAYFARDTATSTDGANNFALIIEAWRPFAVSADIQLGTGEKVRVDQFVAFDVKGE